MLYRLRGSQVSEGACSLSVISILGKVSWLRGRYGHPKGVPPQVYMGKRHLPELENRFHGLRRSNRRCGSRRLLRAMYLLLVSEVTPRLLAGVEPDTHQFYVTV
jgi:hypothetical protein